MWVIPIMIICWILGIVSVLMPYLTKRYMATEKAPLYEHVLFVMRGTQKQLSLFSLMGGLMFVMASIMFSFRTLDNSFTGIFFVLIAGVCFFIQLRDLKTQIEFYDDKIVVRGLSKKAEEYMVSDFCKMEIETRYRITFDENDTDYLPQILFYRLNAKGKAQPCLRISLLTTNGDKALDYAGKLNIPQVEKH